MSRETIDPRERKQRAQDRRARRQRARREAYERWEREYVAALEADYRRALARDEIARRHAEPTTVEPEPAPEPTEAAARAPAQQRHCRRCKRPMPPGRGRMRYCSDECYRASVPPAAPPPTPARVRNLGRR